MVQTTSQSEALSRRAAVYRLHDGNGALLYIGSAYDPEHRAKKHQAKPWWAQVARRTDEWHPSRQAAFEAETNAIREEHPAFNRISGPGAVQLPGPRPRSTETTVELERIDAYIDALRSEPPQVRARRLTELLEGVAQLVRRERRDAVLEMQARGMTYRQIADASGISFGRVRQIIADDPDAPGKPSEE